MRNIFLEKLYTKYGGETKKSKAQDQQSNVLQSLFLLYVQVQEYQNILKLRCKTFVFT